MRPGAIAQSPGREAALAWASLAQRYPASSVLVQEKEMATHSNVLASRIPGTGEPGGLPSTGSHRVGHD